MRSASSGALLGVVAIRECREQVLELRIEAREPMPLLPGRRAAAPPASASATKCRRCRSARVAILARLAQPLQRVLAHRLEQVIARCAIVGALRGHQRSIDQARRGDRAPRIRPRRRRRLPPRRRACIRPRTPRCAAAAPARRRPGGRSSTGWWRAACCWRPSAARLLPVRSRKRSSRRARISSTDSSFTRAAASSIASGMPSSRRQISPMVGTSASDAAKRASLSAARCDEQLHRFARADRLHVLGRASGGKRQRAHGDGALAGNAEAFATRGEHVQAAAPTRAGAWSAQRRRRSGARSCRAPAARVDAATCAHSTSSIGRPLSSRTPIVVATVSATRSASSSGARSAYQTPSGNDGATRSASWMASRDLPLPPMPVSVKRRVCVTSSAYSARSSSCPMKVVSGCGRLWRRGPPADDLRQATARRRA